MSSKVLRGKAVEQAQSVNWTRAPAAKKTPFQEPAVRAEEELEQRLRRMEMDCEARLREARQAAFREAEVSAGQRHAEQTQALYQALAASATEIASLRGRVRREAEEDLVRLALAIARKVMQRELQVDPDAMLGLVKAVLQKIDARELHELRVHPRDAPALTQLLERSELPKRVTVTADSSLTPGSAVFETSRGAMDASIDTQLREIERGFLEVARGMK